VLLQSEAEILYSLSLLVFSENSTTVCVYAYILNYRILGIAFFSKLRSV